MQRYLCLVPTWGTPPSQFALPLPLLESTAHHIQSFLPLSLQPSPFQRRALAQLSRPPGGKWLQETETRVEKMAGGGGQSVKMRAA